MARGAPRPAAAAGGVSVRWTDRKAETLMKGNAKKETKFNKDLKYFNNATRDISINATRDISIVPLYHPCIPPILQQQGLVVYN
jgi:hypothetical protein